VLEIKDNFLKLFWQQKPKAIQIKSPLVFVAFFLMSRIIFIF